MANDAECLFMFLFAIPVSPSVKGLFTSFAHFLIGLLEHILIESLWIYFGNTSFFWKCEGPRARLLDGIMDI